MSRTKNEKSLEPSEIAEESKSIFSLRQKTIKPSIDLNNLKGSLL